MTVDDHRIVFVLHMLTTYIVFASVFFVSIVTVLVGVSWFGCFSSLVLVVRLYVSSCILLVV